MAVTLSDTAPRTLLFIDLRAQCGWGIISHDHADTAIANSLLWASAHQEGETIGFVRLIGDGALNYYIQDLIVAPPFRGQGVGRALIEHLLSLFEGVVPKGATIGLMSVTGKESFYADFGFQARPFERFGAGMTLSYGGKA